MKASTPKQVLIAAKWILSNYEWCQGAMFRDKGGKSTYKEQALTGDLSACCALGAIYLVDADWDIRTTAKSIVRWGIDNNSIINWNDKDHRTKKEVLALFDKLIEEQK